MNLTLLIFSVDLSHYYNGEHIQWPVQLKRIDWQTDRQTDSKRKPEMDETTGAGWKAITGSSF